jgi:hypothetical protein
MVQPNVVAYWLAAHSLPGNSFPAFYATFSLKNTGIQHPVLIDVVSGDIRPLQWKKDTTDTLEALPVTDSIMAIADADYFDWPVLPEAPSSLDATFAGNTVKLSWQVHGGDPQHIVVERREDPTSGRSSWQRISELAASATDYTDSRLKKGQRVSYRVRAVNGDGKSAFSNITRIVAP